MKACKLVELSLSHRLEIFIGIGAQGFVYFYSSGHKHIRGVLPAAHGNERVRAGVHHKLRRFQTRAALGLRCRVYFDLARFCIRIMVISALSPAIWRAKSYSGKFVQTTLSFPEPPADDALVDAAGAPQAEKVTTSIRTARRQAIIFFILG